MVRVIRSVDKKHSSLQQIRTLYRTRLIKKTVLPQEAAGTDPLGVLRINGSYSSFFIHGGSFFVRGSD